MKIHSHNPVSGATPVQHVQATAKKSDARAASTGPATSAKKEPEGAPASEGHSRLDNFAKKIEARFEGALASKDLSPRQQAALEKERDRFHSMIARFEAAYMDSAEGAKMDKIEGMQKLLANFGKSVSHIVAGGEPQPTVDTDVTRQSTPARRPSGRGRDGIDLVG